jgi:hypothetical protein
MLPRRLVPQNFSPGTTTLRPGSVAVLGPRFNMAGLRVQRMPAAVSPTQVPPGGVTTWQRSPSSVAVGVTRDSVRMPSSTTAASRGVNSAASPPGLAALPMGTTRTDSGFEVVTGVDAGAYVRVSTGPVPTL